MFQLYSEESFDLMKKHFSIDSPKRNIINHISVIFSEPLAG